ncbi:hypothetical protein SCWH03_20860 [Streptomyces pacificus]|uniref:Uncharacterized protein n=1 Tax=Streptomyces pacificus TaxID=2705029 RepID=A0A6A0AV97_9ACTN|nr:hypothetical protein SCWH03_20860 [Streptomyces pacificus]
MGVPAAGVEGRQQQRDLDGAADDSGRGRGEPQLPRPLPGHIGTHGGQGEPQVLLDQQQGAAQATARPQRRRPSAARAKASSGTARATSRKSKAAADAMPQLTP